jgi:hypothetical protein
MVGSEGSAKENRCMMGNQGMCHPKGFKNIARAGAPTGAMRFQKRSGLRDRERQEFRAWLIALIPRSANP